MKILVFSDSHGYTNDMHHIIQATSCDMVLHLGDCYDDMLELKDCYDIPVYGVVGNVDFVQGQGIISLNLEGYKIGLCHGHQFRVKSDLHELRHFAQKEGFDLVLFGHTHKAYLDENEGIMNPGSIKFPRGGKNPSYGLLELSKDEKKCRIIYR